VTLHDLFVYAAVLGGALFVAQLVLSAMGAGDADIDLGAGHHGTPLGHTSADTAFKLLSLQGLSSFFAMFGLSGLALSDGSGWPAPYAVAGAALGGTFTTLVITRIFRAAKQLEGSGNLNMRNAVGAEATVYMRILPQKTGKVTVTVQGRSVEVDAVSEEDESFETGARVRVLRANPDGSLVIGKL
jgi:membrane protein implicated in regulation of membrane protease activity